MVGDGFTAGGRPLRWAIIMILRIHIILVSAVVFVGGYIGSTIVFKTMGPHTWSRTHVALTELKMSADLYKEDRGEFPPEDLVNDWLDHVWTNNGQYNHNEYVKLEPFTDLYGVSSYDRLRRWQVPPRYIVSRKISGGCGFYIVGEDGISASSGNDPDDINSWDRDSILFYHKRLWRKRRTRDVSIALFGSVVAFAILTLIRKKQAQQGVATDRLPPLGRQP